MSKNVKIKKGTFYLSSKVDGGEGWEKNEFTLPSTGEKMVRYHKNISLEGSVDNIEESEDKFSGKGIKISIKGTDGEIYYLFIPLQGSSKSVKATNSYFNSIIGPLEVINKGDNVKMFVNNDRTNKKGDLYKNIVVLRPDNTLIKSKFKFTDVPSWSKKEVEDEFGNKVNVWDATEANKFYIDKFKNVVNNFGKQKRENVQEKQEADDLPF